jgi:uncharacterized OsmC-like protein
MIKQTDLSHGEVLVSPHPQGGAYSFVVETQHHTMSADEPNDEGGDDLGPAPFEFLASALASCTAMTLRMYAQHKKIELGQFQVKIHVTRGKDAEGKSHLTLQRDILFLEKVDETLRAKCEEIAGKCPVHRALMGKIDIVTKAA